MVDNIFCYSCMIQNINWVELTSDKSNKNCGVDQRFQVGKIYLFETWTLPFLLIINQIFHISRLNPLSPHDALKHHFTSLKTVLIFLQLGGFRTKISIKLIYQYMVIFFIFQTTSSHLHPLQVENCDSNSRLVVNEDDNGKLRPERVNPYSANIGI